MSYTITTKIPWDETRRALRETFDKWNVAEWTLLPIRPPTARAYYLSPDERRVTLYFKHPSGREVRLTMDAQSRAQDNLRVLYLAMEAMRMNEKRGLGDVIADSYLQLAAPEQHRDPYEVLGIRSNTPTAVIDAAYKALAKQMHPDADGDAEKFKELHAAYERIKEERDGANQA